MSFYVLQTLVVLETSSATSLVCLYCTDAVSPADCDTVIKCGSHESCFVDTFVKASGSIRYNLGCRDENQCDGSLNNGRREVMHNPIKSMTGYFDAMVNTDRALSQTTTLSNYSPTLFKTRGVSKRTNDWLICSECCTGNLCSNTGCGNKEGSCVVQCCKTDMCNINCNKTSSSTTITPVPTVTMTTPPTKGNETVGPTGPSQTFVSTSSFCIYKSKTYNQGDVWQDGCQYNCTCENARTGFYRCQDTCPVWNGLSPSCTLEKKPGECCYQPNCGGTTLRPGDTANTCYYDGKYYREGYQWKVGCKYKCTCQDGKTGSYQCQALCIRWNLPQRCHLDPPPAGKCCQVPICPTNVPLQYPSGFEQE